MLYSLTRFKVKPGKELLVDEWLAFLNNHIEETTLTLNQEKIYVESIFKETIDNVTYLYWYTLEEEGGQPVEQSTSKIDQIHINYWYQCIDESVAPVNLTPQLLLVQNKIKN
ncbi:DUF6176 family protein [Holzapfeliella sp. JNUCC 80]